MFSKRLTLFSLFGFEVRVDISWIFLAILVTWTLAVGVFPFYYPELSGGTYWWMAVVGALGLFFSIIFHEMSHSLVARRYGLPMGGITLFLFGGVAEMKDEPLGPKPEFLMAVAGPIASIVLGVAFYLGHYAVAGVWPLPVEGVLRYLGFINLLLAAFNLVPAFPLDGGRMLRAALWGWKGNLRWATRVASRIGGGFGILLIVLGVVSFVSGNFIGGMWWFLIGWFVRSAAQMSYRQVLIRQGFEGVPVHRVMNPNPTTVPSSLSVDDLVQDYFYRRYYKTFPVVDGERLVGYVALRDVKELPRERWTNVRVADIMSRCSSENTVAPDMDALEALKMMSRTDNSRLLVADGDRLMGIVSLKDMMRYVSLKTELEEEGGLGLGGSESSAEDEIRRLKG